MGHDSASAGLRCRFSVENAASYSYMTEISTEGLDIQKQHLYLSKGAVSSAESFDIHQLQTLQSESDVCMVGELFGAPPSPPGRISSRSRKKDRV
jgi:hypothetical protein